MRIWIYCIGLTWTWCGENIALMSGPGNVNFHKGVYYVAEYNLKVQDKDIEDFTNV